MSASEGGVSLPLSTPSSSAVCEGGACTCGPCSSLGEADVRAVHCAGGGGCTGQAYAAGIFSPCGFVCGRCPRRIACRAFAAGVPQGRRMSPPLPAPSPPALPAPPYCRSSRRPPRRGAAVASAAIGGAAPSAACVSTRPSPSSSMRSSSERSATGSSTAGLPSPPPLGATPSSPRPPPCAASLSDSSTALPTLPAPPPS